MSAPTKCGVPRGTARGSRPSPRGITDLLTYTDTPAQAGTYFYRVVGTDSGGTDITPASKVLRFAAGESRLRYELAWGRNTGARYAMVALNPANAGGTIFGTSLNGGYDQQFLHGPQFPRGTWTHVVVTFSGTYCTTFDANGNCTHGGNTATLYVNGQQAAQMSGIRIDLDDIGSTTHNYLGKSQFPENPNFKGRLGDFRIYEGALSTADVYRLYQAGMAPSRD